jgi:hypothetical protein
MMYFLALGALTHAREALYWAGQVCIRMHKLLAAFVVVWYHRCVLSSNVFACM